MTLDRDPVAIRLFDLIEQAYNGGLVSKGRIFVTATTEALRLRVDDATVVLPLTWDHLANARVEVLRYVVDRLDLEQRLKDLV